MKSVSYECHLVIFSSMREDPLSADSSASDDVNKRLFVGSLVLARQQMKGLQQALDLVDSLSRHTLSYSPYT
jgi:hypothetical protein